MKRVTRRLFFGAERGLELRGHTSRRGGAAPQHRIALLAHKPHPSPYDAQGASLRLTSLFYALRARSKDEIFSKYRR